MSNIPNYEQWGKMNEFLNSIAVSLSDGVDVSTWVGIQKAVRLGLARDFFPIGAQLKVNHGVYGDVVFDVVAHDHFKSASDGNAHTMTLMAHNALGSVEYDGREAFYYAENGLVAGTYNFTIEKSVSNWAAGTYQFALTKALPAGGQLGISRNSSSGALTSLQVVTYADRITTSVGESVSISLGSSGTSLGVFGVELNHAERVSSGSNNYKESALRQVLNSAAGAGNVWSPQTKFDRPPSWVSTLAGYAGGFEDEFLSVVGEVIVPCGSNTVYESPDSTTVKNEAYTVVDRFYPASSTEVGLVNYYGVDDGSIVFPYYKGAVNADRIKQKDGINVSWMTRTARATSSGGVSNMIQIVETDGRSAGWAVSSGARVVPVCNIV